MNKKIHTLFLIFLFFSYNIIFANVNTKYGNETFECSDLLVENVKFWINIFAKYDVHQIVLHDREYLNIVYEVIDLSEEFKDGKYTTKQRSKIIENCRSKYVDILSNLEMYGGMGEDLNQEEYRIFELFKNIDKKNKFYVAKRNIRAQQGLKGKFIEGLINQGGYIKKIKEILREEDVPIEISILPHIESSFNANAKSRYGAVGIWQFTSRTGRSYLRINQFVDERKDPFASTRAIAKLFRSNYERLRSWPLAILAHNYGVNGIERAVKKLNTTDVSTIITKYETKKFGFASKNFYPEFIAVLEVEKNYKMYFGELNIKDELNLESIQLTKNTSVTKLLEVFSIERDFFKELNPHINNSVYLSNGYVPSRTIIYLPYEQYYTYRGDYETLKENVSIKERTVVIPEKEQIALKDGTFKGSDLSIYKDNEINDFFYIYVNPEETIWNYAIWSGVSVNSIKKINNLRGSNSLRPLQKIKIPLVQENQQKFEEERKKYHRKMEEEFFKIHRIENLMEHTVQKGENIWGICYQVYGVPLWLISKYNDLEKLIKIKPGDIVIIPILKKEV